MPQFSITPVSSSLGTAAALIYTVPIGQEVTLSAILSNYSTAAAAGSLWIVPKGEARGSQHLRLVDYPMPSKESRLVLDKISLPPECAIWAGASAATALALQITGTTKGTA